MKTLSRVAPGDFNLSLDKLVYLISHQEIMPERSRPACSPSTSAHRDHRAALRLNRGISRRTCPNGRARRQDWLRGDLCGRIGFVATYEAARLGGVENALDASPKA
jgi:hypothetical protein